MEKINKITKQCPKIEEKIKKNFPASEESLINLNFMGANYLTQKYGVEQLNINALKVFLNYQSNTIFLGQIIIPHGIQIN